jgi:hypothetical protein
LLLANRRSTKSMFYKQIRKSSFILSMSIFTLLGLLTSRLQDLQVLMTDFIPQAVKASMPYVISSGKKRIRKCYHPSISFLEEIVSLVLIKVVQRNLGSNII